MIQKTKLILLLLLLCPTTVTWAGSLQLGTYYPAPFGSYDRLRLVPRAALSGTCDPGSIYVEDTATTLQFCNGSGAWEPLALGYWVQVGSNLYPADYTANIGLGTETPGARLHLVKSSTSTAKDLIIEDIGTGHTGAFAVLKGTNRSWMVGVTNAASSAGGEKLGFIDRTAGDTYRMVIDNTGKVGMGTTDPEFRLTLDKGAATPDGGILAIGTFGSGNTLTTTGSGTRLIWYPRRAAFRAGYVNGTQWDDTVANPNIGDYSVAMGYNSIASGWSSVALGNDPTASQAYAVALGNGLASAQNSLAIGVNAAANNNKAIALGSDVTASGAVATAMGNNATAQAAYSLVIGQWNIVTGDTTNWVDTDPLFVIGNGTSSAARSNALTLLKNGNVGIGTTDPGTNRLEVHNGLIQAAGGLIIETRINNNPSGVNGQFWVCTDIGNATPCDGN